MLSLDKMRLRRFITPPVPSSKYEYFSREKEFKDGRIVSLGSVKVDDPSTRYVGISADDFLLENQLDAGVELHDVKFSQSRMGIIDNIKTVNDLNTMNNG